MNPEQKSIIFSILGVGLIAFISFGYLFYQNNKLTQKKEPPKKLAVATTIFPLYDIVRNISQDKLEIQLILPPGPSPHTFELTPNRIRKLQNPKVIFDAQVIAGSFQ